ncbi:MAG: aminotransferase class V-fold PLP-dependent enzyme [Rhodospirillales bacterium]|nr:aminotransferase class V-fold PLP-dependent enzyme [Rhodospirillales bacterium]
MIGDPEIDFPDLASQHWLNCAHQGPLPACARAVAEEAVRWKAQPWELTSARFAGVPARLKAAIGRLIGAAPEEVILANGASYGLHLLANGIPWQAGDEVLAMEGDFPTDILPWTGLEPRGVTLRLLAPRGRVLDAGEIAAAIGPRTRLLCLTFVHSFSGWAIDLAAIGAVCRERGVLFVVNASQALGARPFDVGSAPVDAVVSVGWKWLCGPYATGFCWMRPELLGQLTYNQNYWLSVLSAEDLGREVLDLITPRGDPGARRYDIFATANFFNFVPWTAAIEFLLERGIEAVAAHDQRLVQRLIDGLDGDRYRLLSPRAGPQRSTLVFIAPHERAQTRAIADALAGARVHVAVRAGALRLAPHLYNTEADIDAALAVLNDHSAGGEGEQRP